MTNLSQDMLRSIEADSFWCMSKLLDGIQVSQFCPCGLPHKPSSTFLLSSILQGPPCSMALPRFGTSIFTSFVSFTAFKRSSITWTLRRSLCCPGFVLRVCHSFLPYTPSQAVRFHIVRLCQAFPVLAVLPISFCSSERW